MKADRRTHSLSTCWSINPDWPEICTLRPFLNRSAPFNNYFIFKYTLYETISF